MVGIDNVVGSAFEIIGPSPINFIRVEVGDDYGGTNLTGQAAIVFEADVGGGGAIYYDSDHEDPGFTTIATLESGTVVASDIDLF